MLKILIPLSIVITTICYFLAPLIAIILKDTNLIPFIRLSVLIIPLFTIYSTFVGYFNGLHLFNKQSYLLIIYSLLKLISIIILSIYFGLYGVIVAFIVSLIGTILAGVLFSEKGKTEYFNSLKLIKFAFPIIVSSIIFVILMNLGLLMIKSILMDDTLVGYYNASFTLSRVPYLFLSGVFGSVILPATSRSIKESLEKTRNFLNRFMKFLLIITLPITFLFSFTSSKLINLFYSEQYALSSKPFSILIYGMVFLAFFIILTAILRGIGKLYIAMSISFVSLVLNFLLNLYFIPHYQLIGAAISITFTGLLALFLISFVIYKEFGTIISIKSFLKVLSASLIISIPTLFINISKYLLPIEYIFFIGIYFIIIYFLKEITKEDIEKIRITVISFIPWL